MRARYAEYLSGNVRVLALDTYASARLRARLYAFDEAAGGQEVDSLDFWVGELGEWSLTRPRPHPRAARRPDRQTVTARFRNRGPPGRPPFPVRARARRMVSGRSGAAGRGAAGR